MSFSLTPFLYQTRTILRMPTHRASARMARSLHATTRRAKDASIPFDYELGPPDESIPVAEVANRGTITNYERRIFERIFADIQARGLKPAFEDDGASTSDPIPMQSARLIMQQAAFDAGQARPATVAPPALLSGAAEDRAKAMFRFPPQLRDAAGKAVDTISQRAKSGDDAARDSAVTATAVEEDDTVGGEWVAPAHTLARTVELAAKRHPERTRIEGLIMSATSDFELWDILEKEVFTMPARLGILKSAVDSQDPEPSSKPKKSGRPSTTGSPDETIGDTKPHVEIDEVDSTTTSSDSVPNPGDSEKLSLYVHGPLYPAYLLLALRRLDTAFHVYSPLVFSVLPRIKELGLESYVLGVSTPFFNELLTIYWTRRGDLLGMLDLLEEMRHCGIYFDSQTASILNSADAAMSDLASQRSHSEFGKVLMLMPEYEQSQRDRIRHWHRAVDMSAKQRLEDIR